MRLLRVLTSVPSLIIITHFSDTSAQNQRYTGDVSFPGQLRGRTGQVNDRIRATAKPLSISTHHDGCLDSFLPEQCSSWKETIGCSESNMRVGCKRTCGICQAQGAGLSSLPTVNQGHQVISMQPPKAQPTVPQNSGLLIISHSPSKPAHNNNLPLGPTSITLQATSKPSVTSSPAPVPTSSPVSFGSRRPVASLQPVSVGDRNIGINLFGGEPTMLTTATRSPELVPSTQKPSPPVIQPMIPLDTIEVITNPGTELPFLMPDSWRGNKSKLPFGHSALTVAARNQNGEDVKTFIQNGANVDHQDNYGMSALMWIAGHGNNNILELLLQAGASPNLTDSLGSSALMYAAFNNHVETVEKLLDHDADIDAQDSDGETALMSASRNGHYYTIEVLLRNDAQVSLQDNQGMTALHYAALKQCVQCVEMLIRKCPDITLKNYIDKTPLDIAKEKGNNKIITLIEGLLQPSCIHAGETFPAGSRRVESCIELECKCGGHYEPTGNNDLSCLVLNGFL